MEVGGLEQGWYLRVKPPATGLDTRHLLAGREIRPWLLREIERLELAVSGGSIGMSLADGGEPVHDPSAAYPDADWDAVWGEIFLQP